MSANTCLHVCDVTTSRRQLQFIVIHFEQIVDF